MANSLVSSLILLGCLLSFNHQLVYSYPPAQSVLRAIEPLAPISKPLQDVFQVHAPVLTPAGPYAIDGSSDASEDGPLSHQGEASKGPVCARVLMEHSFGNSYGHPYVGRFIPEEDMSSPSG